MSRRGGGRKSRRTFIRKKESIEEVLWGNALLIWKRGLGPGGAGGGWWAEVDFDLRLGFGGLVVEVGGLVAPVVKRSRDVGKKGQGTVERLHVTDVTVFVDGGEDGDGSGGNRELRDLGIDAGGEFAEDDFLVSAPEPSFAGDAVAGNAHGTLDVHGQGSGSQDALAGQIYVGGGQISREISGRSDFEYARFGDVHLDDR
jgi:hypothetical protein